MTEESKASTQPATPDADEAERKLGRTVAYAIPCVTIAAALVVRAATSAGPTILVLASGTLLGTVALLWASLRTLGGDAPLPEGMQAMAATTDRVTEAEERKKKTLRALKDLEHEHSVGKLDDEDYAELAAHYRAEAKAVMREIDTEIEPLREKAEAMAQKHLQKRGIVEKATETKPEPEPAPESNRVACPQCTTSNELDASFCKKCGHALQAADKDEEEEEPVDASA